MEDAPDYEQPTSAQLAHPSPPPFLYSRLSDLPPPRDPAFVFQLSVGHECCRTIFLTQTAFPQPTLRLTRLRRTWRLSLTPALPSDVPLTLPRAGPAAKSLLGAAFSSGRRPAPITRISRPRRQAQPDARKDSKGSRRLSEWCRGHQGSTARPSAPFSAKSFRSCRFLFRLPSLASPARAAVLVPASRRFCSCPGFSELHNVPGSRVCACAEAFARQLILVSRKFRWPRSPCSPASWPSI